MPREFPRSRRVEEAIQRALSEAISGKARDPRLGGVIITDVRVSRDISVAKVYYTMLSGGQPAPEIGVALQAASGFLRSTLARELRLRHVPELRFLKDEALARSRSLEDLIAKAVSGHPESASGSGSSRDEPE
jgi:ribosome-binding factor A